MKKYYTFILALLLAQGAMATDYNHLRTSSKLSAISKAELTRQATADSTLRVLIRMTPGSDAYPFGSMSGTSMSSPYMSGICALWLEADSTLTHTQIRDIAQQTAINDTYCTSDNYYTKLGDGNQAGAGKVDAYAGLKYILDQKTSILSPIAEGKDFMIRTLDGCTFEAYTAGATSMTAFLYTLDGRKVASNSKPGNTITLSAQGQTKGIYVLRISDGKHTHAQKVVVK